MEGDILNRVLSPGTSSCTGMEIALQVWREARWSLLIYLFGRCLMTLHHLQHLKPARVLKGLSAFWWVKWQWEALLFPFSCCRKTTVLNNEPSASSPSHKPVFLRCEEGGSGRRVVENLSWMVLRDLSIDSSFQSLNSVW